jgi:hypothetical protein
MKVQLTREMIAMHLARLREIALFEDCWNCYWLQRFLSQLELDADPDAAPLIQPFKIARKWFHRHCGCKPCPPDAAFNRYLDER